MTRLLLVVISMACVVLGTGCNKDPKGLFANLAWQVACSSSGSCTSDSPPREVLGYDGQPNEGDTSGDVNATCTFNRSGAQAIVTLTAMQPGYSIAIDGLVIDNSGTGLPNLSPSCSVQLTETDPFDLSLEGACNVGSGTTEPCTVTAEITRIDGDPTLNLSVACVGITSPADPVNIVRDLQLGLVASPTSAALLQIRNCDGQ